jgi:phosphonate transport system ATP-binding protein
MIFQHYNLIGRTNVIKNILHGRLGHMSFFQSLLGLYPDSDRERAFSLLEEVGLADQVYKRADALSGGQMQRVGICRALMQEPKILLADEPIASLDPKSAEIVMDQLKRMAEDRGICCIVNLHQVDFARRYASRIIGIKQGALVFDGSPELFTQDVARSLYEGKEAQMGGGTEIDDREEVVAYEPEYAAV